MNLIDRYIAEIGKHLPRKNRADIEAEIRSILEDMLDERKPADGPADEATIMQLLKEYGPPHEVAAKYRMHSSHQYLIGPPMYQFFKMVLRIVFAVVIGASLLGLAVSLTKTGLTGPAFVSSIGEWFTGLLSGLIAAFGNIVLVFAILERTKVANEFEKEFKEWDPEELKSEPDPDQIDLPDHIATLIFTVLGLVVLNLYPHLLAIRYLHDGTWVSIPVLTDAFFRFLPWINILSLIQIVFHGFMLGQRNWTPVTRITEILLNIAGMILSVVILTTPGVFDITPETWNAIGAAGAAESLSRLFNLIPTIIVIIVVVTTILSVIKNLLRLVRPSSPYPVMK